MACRRTDVAAHGEPGRGRRWQIGAPPASSHERSSAIILEHAAVFAADLAEAQ